MKPPVFFLFLAVCFFSSFASKNSNVSHQVDSLTKQLINAREDTNKIKTLYRLSLEFLNQSNFDSSSYFLQQGKLLSDKLNYKWGIAKALSIQGSILKNSQEYDTAINFYNKAIKQFKVLKRNRDLASSFYDLAWAYDLNNQQLKAIDAFHQTVKLYDHLLKNHPVDSLRIKKIIMVTYWRAGTNLEDAANYVEALEHYQKSLDMAKNLIDYNFEGTVLINFGNLYGALNDKPKAINYYKKAQKIFEHTKDKIGLGIIYLNLCSIYTELDQKDSSIYYLPLAEQIFRSPVNNRLLSETLITKASILTDQKKYDSALKSLYESLRYIRISPERSDMAEVYKSIGELFRIREKYTIAEHYLDSSQAIVNDLKLKPLLRNNALAYSTLYEDWSGKVTQPLQVNYLKDALGQYKLFKNYSDSVFDEDKNKEITRKEMSYEFQKKEAAAKAEQEMKDEQAREELERQKLIRNGTTAGLVLVLIFSIVVFRQRNKISKEKQRSDELLLNILPIEVANELKTKGHSEARHFDQVTVLFTDFQNFTQMAENLPPQKLVAAIDECFKAFDQIISKCDIEKIKTIGDSYMAAGGLPAPDEHNAKKVVMAALEMQEFLKKYSQQDDKPEFKMRTGIHTGPVVAGIVGVKKFQYDIWGDTVNTASRMESNGKVGKVNISQSTYELIKSDPQFQFEPRGKIQAKGKGEIDMYFIQKDS